MHLTRTKSDDWVELNGLRGAQACESRIIVIYNDGLSFT